MATAKLSQFVFTFSKRDQFNITNVGDANVKWDWITQKVAKH